MTLRTITAHLATHQTRRATLDGREYVVARVVPIMEAVLNNYFIPREEIAAYVEAWNYVPVPLGHPQNDYGDYISARSPGQVEHSLGHFFNAHMQGTKLVGEVWLDLEKCQRLGGEAAECLRRIEANEPIECSTAFFPETDMTPGIFNGVRYQGIHRHLRPDHLALLPDAVGACSIADGCGVRPHHLQCQCQGACASSLSAQARTTARRPTFTGTERTPWSKPTFQTYTHALFHGATLPSSVGDCSAMQRRRIAAHTLLGDETADTFDALSIFPVVNPRTGKLNERALRAVISGRGAQADLPAAAKDSAQAMARRLLNSEFDANLEAHMDPDKQSRFKTAINTILAFASGTRPEDDGPAAIQTHVTHEDIAQALASLLSETMQTPYYWGECVVDVEDGFVIYREQGELYRRAYTVDSAGAVALTGEPEAVQRNTQYVPLTAQTAQQPGGTVSQQQERELMKPKADLVRALIAHQQTTWTDADTALLQTFSEEQLTRLTAEAEARTPAATEPVLQARSSSPATETTEPPLTLAAIQSILKSELDARDQALEGRLAVYSQEIATQQERAQLVAHLQALGWSEQECTGLPLETLRKIDQQLSPTSYAGIGVAAYGAMGQEQREADLPDDAPKGWDS